MSIEARNITIAYGDGIGSEIMESALLIMREAGANIAVETIEIGERIYNMGGIYGILPSAWDILKRNKILLKSPIFIPENPNYSYKHTNEIIYEKFELTKENLLISNMMKLEDSDWLAGSENINDNFALFEPIHDCAPEIAGKNIANPSGVIQSAIMMLNYIGQEKTANLIKNAWLKTLDAGIHTADIYNRKTSHKKVGTMEFTEEIVARL